MCSLKGLHIVDVFPKGDVLAKRLPLCGNTLKMCFREAPSTLWKHIEDVLPLWVAHLMHIKDVFPERAAHRRCASASESKMCSLKGLHIVDVFPKGDVLAKRLHME
jgi:hypothetical protein